MHFAVLRGAKTPAARLPRQLGFGWDKSLLPGAAKHPEQTAHPAPPLQAIGSCVPEISQMPARGLNRSVEAAPESPSRFRE
jgi:hypothetical protein